MSKPTPTHRRLPRTRSTAWPTAVLIAGLPLLTHPIASAQTYTGIDDALPQAVSLQGNTKDDGWYNFSTSTKDKQVDGNSYTIPGLTGYPTALSSSPAWKQPVPSQLQSDASDKAAFNKISNGNGSSYTPGYDSYGVPNGLANFAPNGTPLPGSTWKRDTGATGANGYGPIPSGDSLYAISFSDDFNARQGTVGVFEAKPVANLKNVVLQLEIGSANGYDLWNHSVNGPADDLPLGKMDASTAFPLIRLTLTNTAQVTVAPKEAQLIAKGYNGTVQMPTGPGGSLEDQPIYINRYGFQYDLSQYANIASFDVTWTDVEHSQLYAARLDQGDQYSPVINASVPEPSGILMAAGLVIVFCFRRRSARRGAPATTLD